MSQFKANTVIGKRALDSNTRDVGKISDISFDTSSWTIVGLHLKVPGQICVEVGISKFKLGSKTILLLPEFIKQIGDSVQLTSPIQEVISQAEIV